MRLLLIRHAEQQFPGPPDYEDPPLSAAGRAQAQQLARGLRGGALQRVVSSGMVRAVQTAHEIAALLDLPHMVEPHLAEIHLGALAPWGACQELEWHRITARWAQGDLACGCPSGESLADVVARVEPAIARVLADAQGRDFALVAHAVVNGAILSLLCPSLRPLLGQDLGHHHTGVWELEGDGSHFRVLRRNDTRHLA